MDLSSFAKATVAGVPLVFVIIGLVAYFKAFKRADGSPRYSGNALLRISMTIGVFFGSVYMLTQARPPAGDWWVLLGYAFGVLVYGVALGLVASGLYDVARGLVEKTFSELFKGVVVQLGKK